MSLREKLEAQLVDLRAQVHSAAQALKHDAEAVDHAAMNRADMPMNGEFIGADAGALIARMNQYQALRKTLAMLEQEKPPAPTDT